MNTKKIISLISSVVLLFSAMYCGATVNAEETKKPQKFVQSFEDDGLAQSATTNFTFSEEQARTGSKSIKMTKAAGNTNANSFSAVFKDEADKLKENVPYSVYFYLKPVTVERAVEISFYRNATVNNFKGNSSANLVKKFNLTNAQINSAPVDENGWHKILLDAEFYVDSENPYMNFWNCQWDGNATFYIDDITFEPITANEIGENLLNSDPEHWAIGKKWSNTSLENGVLTVTGGTGVATFTGKKTATQNVRVRLTSAVTNDWAGIAFRNQADPEKIKADGQNAYFYDIGNSYVLYWNASKIQLMVSYLEVSAPKWKSLTSAAYNMSDGKEHTIEIKTTDNTENNTTFIEVFIDGVSRLSATDSEYAIKPDGYTQIVCSSQKDSVTVTGFEIVGEKTADYIKQVPTYQPKNEITENLFTADSQNWIFGREWSDSTAIADGKLTVNGGTGIATFTGKKTTSQTIRAKIGVSVQNDWAALSFRNQADISALEKSGQNAYFMTTGNAYALLFNKTGVSLKVAYAKDKWKALGKEYVTDLSDGKEHMYEIVMNDDTAAKTTSFLIYMDGTLIIDTVDSEYAVKDAGYVSFVCSNKNDRLTASGFEIDGAKVSEYMQGAPVVSGANLVSESAGWFFYKGWGYEGYTGTTGFVNNKIKVCGDYGTAFYNKSLLGEKYAELKFKTHLSEKGVVFIGLRNAATAAQLEKDKSAANTMSKDAGGYILRIMKEGIALGVRGSDGNFKTIGTKYLFASGFDINAQSNTLITRIVDNKDEKSSRIEIWFNSERIMTYVDTEYAIRADGGYSVTLADQKNNTDYIEISSFKMGSADGSPQTGDKSLPLTACIMLSLSAAAFLWSLKFIREYALKGE